MENEVLNRTALEVEIGCGKGRFIVDRAQSFPHIRFIAIDRLWRFMKTGDYRAKRRNLENLTFVHADANVYVKESIEDTSVSVFHIYFPDPWPKRRQCNRRIIQPEFLDLLAQKTVSNGLLEIATDHEDYYRYIINTLRQRAHVWALLRESINERLFFGNEKTNYETRFEHEGRTLHYLELQKK